LVKTTFQIEAMCRVMALNTPGIAAKSLELGLGGMVLGRKFFSFFTEFPGRSLKRKRHASKREAEARSGA
jgi:hypothetical protein